MSHNAASRPFTPPIHVLILPSKIPLDLRLHFRDLYEEHVVCRMRVFFYDLGQLTCQFSERNVPTRPHELAGNVRSVV